MSGAQPAGQPDVVLAARVADADEAVEHVVVLVEPHVRGEADVAGDVGSADVVAVVPLRVAALHRREGLGDLVDGVLVRAQQHGASYQAGAGCGQDGAMTDSVKTLSDMIYRYSELFDTGDFDGFAAQFEHGRWHRAEPGTAATRQWIAEHVQVHDGLPRTKHVITNLIVDVDEERARPPSRSYITVWQAVRPSSPCKRSSPGATTTGSNGSTASGAGSSAACWPTCTATRRSTSDERADRAPAVRRPARPGPPLPAGGDLRGAGGGGRRRGLRRHRLQRPRLRPPA